MIYDHIGFFGKNIDLLTLNTSVSIIESVVIMKRYTVVTSVLNTRNFQKFILNFLDRSVLYLICNHHTCRLGYDRVNHPPHENFFSQKDTSEDFLDTPGPKKTYLGHFSSFSGVSSNTWQLPGVTWCMSCVSKKNFTAEGRKKVFF